MKKPILFFFVAVIVFGCKKSSTDPDNSNDTATFKVELTQSGDYKEYQRLITLTADMVYEGTNRAAIVLSDGDLENDKYSFVTSQKLDVFEPSFIVGWYGDQASEASLEIKIYRNNALIDTKIISLKPENAGQQQTYSWTYKAK